MKKIILGTLAAVLVTGAVAFACSFNCCTGTETCPSGCKDCCKETSCCKENK